MPYSNSPFSRQELSNELPILAASSETEFLVQFWGVRRGVATPGSETRRYGGNTTCVEMRVAGKRLIFDGGTGLRVLGKTLQPPVEAHLFFTHSHWDRIQGFPFFTPAFNQDNCFHIYGATAVNGASMKQRLYEQMLQPYFTYPLHQMQCDFKFHHLTSGKVVTLGDVTIETASINKAHRAMGYRVTWQKQLSVVYATDLEYCQTALDPSLLQLASEADLLIGNANSTEPVSQNCQSKDTIWQTTVALAQAAGVKRLALFHYDPDDDDDYLDQVEELVQSAFPKSLLAREGMVLPIV